MSGDYDDLLCGLGSDDLDDFDLEEGGKSREDDRGQADEYDDDFDKILADGEKLAVEQHLLRADLEDPFLASIISHPPSFGEFTGFSTGAGRGLPPPSAAALARGRKIVEEAVKPVEGSEDDTHRLATIPSDSIITDYPVSHSCGFTTGAGRPVAPPSAASFAKAAALFADNPDEIASPHPQKRRKSNHHSMNPAPTPFRFARQDELVADLLDLDAGQMQALERFSDPVDELDDVDISHHPTLQAKYSIAAQPCTTGFTTGAGAPLAAPSKSALAAVANLFSDIDEPPSTPAPAFTAGSGGALPRPSTSSHHAAAPLFSDLDKPSTTASFAFASGSPAPMGAASRARAFKVFGESPLPTTNQADTASTRPDATTRHDALVTPSRPLPRSSTNSFRSPMLSSRTPLQQHTNTFSMPTQAKPIMIKSELRTPTMKRLGAGGRPTSLKRSRTSFSTPFKDGGAKARMAVQGSQGTPVRAAMPKVVVRDEVVFDMTVPPHRQTMREAYLKPGYYARAELEEMGLPGDLWELDLSNACTYYFREADVGVDLGSTNALAILQADGCRHVTRQWVDNHYSQILWKLAGLCRAQPSLFSIRWNWTEVIDQLKYRYEREIGRAERPIVRRIQEHDSSGAVPMVLVVSAIRWVATDAAVGPGGKGGREANGSQAARGGVTGSQHDGRSAGMMPFLELTDGWYRIYAEVDPCLTRAVEKGRITLDSANDGEEVLNALNKSRLVLSGNSTSLARWDVKLGLHSPFVAGLASLSPDGGVVNMIDVVLEKVFDIAWLNTDKSTHEDPWNEAEEAIRRDRWQEKYLSEIARLNEEMEMGLEQLRALAESLASSAEGVEPDQGSPPDDIDDQFERLLGAKDQNRMLGQLSDAMVYHLAIHAGQRLQQEIAQGHADVQAEVNSSHPPRDVRHFRMVRVRDAIDGDRPLFRNAMLTVWDAKGLDIKEGGRYRITSLYPGRQGDWSLPKSNEGEVGAVKEIYLGTRRETRWLAVA